MGLDPAALRLLAATDRLQAESQAIDLIAERMGPLSDTHVFGRAHLWTSSTVYVPPNPRPTGPKDAAKQLRYELAKRSLPDLAAPPRLLSQLHIGNGPLHADGLELVRAGGERPPVATGYFFELRFTAEISGPLAFGWSCHRGLGQFAPMSSSPEYETKARLPARSTRECDADPERTFPG
jgi:CRISPR-associated protein Csb2